MTRAFNPPPHWPEPPRRGWRPPDGWTPDRSWGAVPAGWRLWVDDPQAPPGAAPLAESEEIPASGARVRPRVEKYPVDVVNPGMWSQNDLEEEDYGFPPEKPRRRRARLRLGLTITVTVLGFLMAGATAFLFWRLYHFAIEDLPVAHLGSDHAVHQVGTASGGAGAQGRIP